MSFRCDKCGEKHPSRSKPNVVVTEWWAGKDGQPQQIKKEQKLCDLCAGKPVVEKPVVRAVKPAEAAPVVVEQKTTA